MINVCKIDILWTEGNVNCWHVDYYRYCNLQVMRLYIVTDSYRLKKVCQLLAMTRLKAWTLFNWQIPARWTKFYVQNTLQRYVLNWIGMNWILHFILFYLRSFSFICTVCTCIAAFWQLLNNKRISMFQTFTQNSDYSKIIYKPTANHWCCEVSNT